MGEEDKTMLQVTGGLCGCLLFAFAAIVFIVAAAIKWVIS